MDVTSASFFKLLNHKIHVLVFFEYGVHEKSVCSAVPIYEGVNPFELIVECECQIRGVYFVFILFVPGEQRF